ncbi:MAG: hypothetical protein L0216_03180 [Planctomycetales bacterium]|nr:hypothetical protein [Planctomycetales bacterium]
MSATWVAVAEGLAPAAADAARRKLEAQEIRARVEGGSVLVAPEDEHDARAVLAERQDDEPIPAPRRAKTLADASAEVASNLPAAQAHGLCNALQAVGLHPATDAGDTDLTGDVGSVPEYSVFVPPKEERRALDVIERMGKAAAGKKRAPLVGIAFGIPREHAEALAHALGEAGIAGEIRPDTPSEPVPEALDSGPPFTVFVSSDDEPRARRLLQGMIAAAHDEAHRTGGAPAGGEPEKSEAPASSEPSPLGSGILLLVLCGAIVVVMKSCM